MCYDIKQTAMTRRSSDLKDAIEKLKKLKALQAKATDKLNRITEESKAAPLKKKNTPRKPAVKRRAGPAAKKKAKPLKKPSFWQKLFGKKSGVKKDRHRKK